MCGAPDDPGSEVKPTGTGGFRDEGGSAMISDHVRPLYQYPAQVQFAPVCYFVLPYSTGPHSLPTHLPATHKYTH